jgi:carbonic anhydrase/acetyltransferase-like protein (isoleucine patch superfamily)
MSILRGMGPNRIRLEAHNSIGRFEARYRRGVAIYALDDQIPQIHESAYVHPEAVIIGSVIIGAESSIWPGAVLRGDDGEIRIGARSSIQDNAVVHTTPNHPTVVGDDCVIGHLVHLEGCRIETGSLIGNSAMVLHRCIVGPGAVVAANSVVLNDVIVPSGSLAAGSPAVIKAGRARNDAISAGVASYVARAHRYGRGLRRLD